MKAANLIGVPVLVTEQNPLRMGETVESLASHANPNTTFSKMSFSAWGCDEFRAEVERLGRKQIVLVGMETHICISLTADDLLEAGYQVVVCPDAVSSRTLERHKLGMERIRDAGAVPAHSESVVYEWIGSAASPTFKPILQIVKEAPL
jgi:nicotinamidase-related amidase